MYQLDYRV